MSDTKSKFDIEKFLDSERERAEKLEVFDEISNEGLRKKIMYTYDREYVKLYYLSSITWSPQEGKFLLKWSKRSIMMELSDKDYDKEFEYELKKIKL